MRLEKTRNLSRRVRHTSPNARAYYQQKRSEGKRHNAAVTCVARKRCDIILAMLKTQTPYQPTQHQPQTKKLPHAA